MHPSVITARLVGHEVSERVRNDGIATRRRHPLDRLQHERTRARDHVGARVDQLSRDGALWLSRRRGVLATPVHAHHYEIR